MKILNNKTADIAGSHIICEHCGAELIIEASDAISVSDYDAKIYKTTPYLYTPEDDFLFVRRYIGTLYKVTCASCGATIGFIKYGQHGIANGAIINPKRYWVNQEDNEFYVVDIALSIKNALHNKNIPSYRYEYDCHGDITDYNIVESQKIPVYGGSFGNILKIVQKTYPAATKDSKCYQEQISHIKRINSNGGSGYANMVVPGEPCPGGIHVCNIRKNDKYIHIINNRSLLMV